jgi:crotonobetainyl-CoA:carnitine CoA-transferase CaiB-like acyl-CoA transferase
MPVKTGAELTQTLLHNLANRMTSSNFDLVRDTNDVLSIVGASAEDCGGKLSFYGADPVAQSVVRMGGMAAIALAAKAVMVAKIWKMRTGLGQDIHVDARKSLHRFAGFGEGKWVKINGNSANLNYDPENPLNPFGARDRIFFPTKDGQTMTTCNGYPRARDRVLKFLNCVNTTEGVKAAIKQWDSEELDQAANKAGLVMSKCRRLEDALKLDVYDKTFKDMPLITIEKVGDSDPVPFTPNATDPLSGVKVLGSAHTVAGPAIGSALAFHGADVLNVFRPYDFEPDLFLWATHMGTRSTILDLDQPEPRAKFYDLLKGADVFYLNRRIQMLDRYGLGYQEMCAKKPGLIHARVVYAADKGEWSQRSGYDVTTGAEWGIFNLEGTDEMPDTSQVKIVNDYVTGWLCAVGVLEALRRRSIEGGSYRVQTSLSRVSLWLLSLGIFDKDYMNKTRGSTDEHSFGDPDLFTAETVCGSYQGLGEQVYMMRTPGRYHTVLTPKGSSKPVWLS